MSLRTNSIASAGVTPQFVGQVESTSTIESPLPFASLSKALRMAFLASRMCAGESMATLCASATPSSVLISSHIFTGWPAVCTSLPYGVVCVT